MLFLGGCTATILAWEDFAWVDNGQFTAATLRGMDYPVQIWKQDGRFAPLSLQEFNVIRHLTKSVVGYHAFPIFELLIFAAAMVLLDDRLSIAARVALTAVALSTTGVVMCFTELIYPERNVLVLLALMALCVNRYEQTGLTRWAVGAVACAHVMLYFKEPVFLLLLSYAAARIVLRGRAAFRDVSNLAWITRAENRLDLCIAAVSVVFVACYALAMLPHTDAAYLAGRRLPLAVWSGRILQTDLLVWVFAAVAVTRGIWIFRGKAAPDLLWDGLACGGVVYFCAYLFVVRITNRYYLAPSDFIAVLYLGRLLFLGWQEMRWCVRLAAATVAVVVTGQSVLESARQVLERKYYIQRMAVTADAIKALCDRDPKAVRKLYFPVATGYRLVDFASYLSYRGVPVEIAGVTQPYVAGVRIFGSRISSDRKCFSFGDFVCHPGLASGDWDMEIVLPQEWVLPEEMSHYEEVEAKWEAYADPRIPRLLMRILRVARRLPFCNPGGSTPLTTSHDLRSTEINYRRKCGLMAPQPTDSSSDSRGLTGSARQLMCYCPDPKALFETALRYRRTFQGAAPFPHVAIDNLFPESVLLGVLDELPSRKAQQWTRWGSGSQFEDADHSIKMGISREAMVGPVTRNFMLQLNSALFLQFLGILSGVAQDSLLGDPTFRGGGLHSTGSGGRLLVHADTERHPLGTPFCQKLNIIIYLNRDWPEEYGGHLELWSRDGSQCVQRIAPVFNRTVIFESGTNTFHGHPRPLTCPPDRFRISLAAYYYCLNRAIDENYTGFQTRVKWIHDEAGRSPAG